jgi:hypothetical protein
MSVAWFCVEDLGAVVRRHRVDDTVSKAFATLVNVALVVVDDIGLLPISSDAAEGSIASSTPPTNAAQWRCPRISTPPGSISLMDKIFTSALVDRFVHHAHVITTKGTQT